MFTFEVFGSLCDDAAELYTKQIISIVKEEKLPFILCLKHADIENTERNITFFKKVMKKLQAGLNTIYSIIRIESLLSKLICFVTLQLATIKFLLYFSLSYY